jgi:hypothetical protein
LSLSWTTADLSRGYTSKSRDETMQGFTAKNARGTKKEVLKKVDA